MTKKKYSAPGSADVIVHMHDGDVTLKPTLEACLKISRLHNAPMTTAGRISDMDFDTVVQVIAIGADLKPDAALQERVYKTGLLSMLSPLIQFVHVVNNGGRPVDISLDEDAEPDPR